MTEEKLLPCPFCGGKAEIRKHGNTYVPDDLYKVMCFDCHTTNPWNNSPTNAIDKWNKRI